MAITPMTVIVDPGLSPLTVNYFDLNQTLAGTATATESGTSPGLYNFDVPEDISGLHSFHVMDGSVLLGVWYSDLSNTTDLQQCRDLAIVNQLPAPPEDDVYHADIDLTYDDADGTDKYTVTWFKNAIPITSGITSPTIEVTKQSDGSTLISTTALSDNGNGEYKYNELVNRMASGDAGVAKSTAMIDGSTREFKDNVGRDNTV